MSRSRPPTYGQPRGGAPRSRAGWSGGSSISGAAPKRSCARYFEESLELLWTADMTGRLLRVNPAWERCLGHPGEAMCGTPLTEFIHPQRPRRGAAAILLARRRLQERVTRPQPLPDRSRQAAFGSNGAHAPRHGEGVHPRRPPTTSPPSAEAERQLADEARPARRRWSTSARGTSTRRAPRRCSCSPSRASIRDDETAQHTERSARSPPAIGTQPRPQRGERRAAARSRPAARHRQARDPRRDPAQAGQAQRATSRQPMQTHADARRPPAVRQPLADAAAGRRRRSSPTTSAGTARATRSGLTGSDIPLVGPHRRGRGRVRRAHPRPALQGGLAVDRRSR